jgi:hypothetical protein
MSENMSLTIADCELRIANLKEQNVQSAIYNPQSAID